MQDSNHIQDLSTKVQRLENRILILENLLKKQEGVNKEIRQRFELIGNVVQEIKNLLNIE